MSKPILTSVKSVAGAIENPETYFGAEKVDLLKRLGATDTLKPTLNRVWIAIWKRPSAKTIQCNDGSIGKLLLTDETRDEDIYQGNSGLVVKLGPMAFKSDAMTNFEGSDVKVGDWVLYNRQAAGLRFKHNGVHCIMLEREDPIKAVLTRPDLVE